MEPSHDIEKELTVTFQPPLYLERRGWIFDILRRERVRTVLDVGCGEGELISCLCNPAPWLPPPPIDVLEALSYKATTADSKPSANLATTLEASAEGWLHPSKVMALDISAIDLQDAIQGTAPGIAVRWEPLEVTIWEGGLESINAEFIDVECIVSTEVVEHLPEEILDDFAPIMLGVYHPRLLLITTPSYTFNARFTAPTAPVSARSGFPDPTGRTSRIFRHHDHKFEWTVDEFKTWCQRIAAEWGYEVEIGGVGKPTEKDEWGRDEELGYASQVAAFRRREGEEYANDRRERSANLMEVQDAYKRPEHKLLATHHHAANQKARQPGALEDIGNLIKARMILRQERTMRLAEMWFEDDVADLCGGWIEIMIAAVDDHPDLQLHRTESNVMSDWQLEITGDLIEDNKSSWRESIPYADAESNPMFPDWQEEPEESVAEHAVLGGLDDIESHWDDIPKELHLEVEDDAASQWSSDTFAPPTEGWVVSNTENGWGAEDAESWVEPRDVLVTEADAVWQ